MLNFLSRRVLLAAAVAGLLFTAVPRGFAEDLPKCCKKECTKCKDGCSNCCTDKNPCKKCCAKEKDKK